MTMMKGAQMWWQANGALVSLPIALWSLNRRLDVIEWQCRLEALLEANCSRQAQAQEGGDHDMSSVPWIIG
jgi:hypothetical protein